MLKVRNNQTGEIEEIPESKVAEAISSGIYSVQQGIKIPVLSPDGKPGTIDSSEAYTAFQSGFSYDTEEMRDERRKQAQFGDSPVSATALGAARGLSFGLSDQALQKSGLVEQETLREIKERNPELSIAGEVLGVIAPAVVSGGSSLLAKGATSGVRAVTSAGLVAEKTVAKALSKRLAVQGEMTLAKKVLANAGSKAAGSAVEGAFYGAGHLISEDALGNADLNAEALIANMGVGAFIGGIVGGGLGAVGPITQSGVELGKKTLEPVRPFFRKVLGAKDLPDEVGILASLQQKKADVGDLKSRAERLEVELTTGTLSANQRVRDAESILNETPSIFGQEVQRVAEANRVKLQRGTEGVFTEAGKRTEREVGTQVIEDMKDILQKKYDPFNSAYEEIRKFTPHIEVDEAARDLAHKNIRKLGGEIGAKGGEIAEYASKEADILVQQRSVNDLNNYISELKSRARGFRQTDMRKAFAADQIAKKAEDLRRHTILVEAKRLTYMGFETAEKTGHSIISSIRQTNRKYREFMQFMTVLGEEGRLGKGTFGQVVERLEKLDPEAVARRFIDPKRMDAIQFMQKNFPAQLEELRRLRLAQLAEEVSERNPTHGVQYNLAALERNFDKLGKTPEYREFLLGKKGVQTLEDIVTLNRSIPGVSNPSRTDIRRDFERLLTPILWARDAALLGILKGAKGSSKEAQTVQGVEWLARVEKGQKKSQKTIKQSIDRFLKGTERVGKRTSAVTTSIFMDTNYSGKRKKEEDNEEAFHSRATEIAEFIAKPQLLVDNLERNTATLQTVAPKTALAVQIKATQALNFLHEKLPSNPAAARSNNLSIRKWKPSTVELRKFEKYMKAVEKPISVIEDLERGIINREGIETLKAVYPEIYTHIVTEVTDRVTELRTELPYGKRLLLSNLLEVPIDLAQEPDFLLALQMQYAPKEETPQEGGIKPTAKGIGNIDMASQVETEAQRIVSRT